VLADSTQLAAAYKQQQGAILDHVLSEKMKDAHVIACTFDWIDIGNFYDLHSVSPLDNSENHLRGRVDYIDVSESYLHNETDVPVAVVGLDNVVVVVTDNGILVANKSQARKVGVIAKQITQGE